MASTFIDVVSQSNLLGTTFSPDVLQPNRPDYIFDDLCKERQWDGSRVPHKGDTIVYTVKSAYTANTAALSPTVTDITPGSQKRSYTRQTISFELYGDHDVVDIMQLPVETFADDVLDVASSLQDQGLNSRNLLARTAMDGLIDSSTYNFYGSSGTASSMGELKAIDIRKAVASLRGGNIPVFPNGNYVCVLNERQYTQLRADSDNASWTESTKYVNNEPLKAGKIMEFEGVSFVVNNQIKTETGGADGTAHAMIMGREFVGKAVGFDLKTGTKSSLDGPHDNLLTVHWEMLLGYGILRREAARVISTKNTYA